MIEWVANGFSELFTCVGAYDENDPKADDTTFAKFSWLIGPAPATIMFGPTKWVLWCAFRISSFMLGTFSLIPNTGYPIKWSL